MDFLRRINEHVQTGFCSSYKQPNIQPKQKVVVLCFMIFGLNICCLFDMIMATTLKETRGRRLCVVDVAETQFHNLDEINVPRFFSPTMTNFTKIAFLCHMLTQKSLLTTKLYNFDIKFQ